MFAGHIFRSKLVTKDIMFWSAAAHNSGVKRSVGRSKLSFVDTLLDDVGVGNVEQLKALMIDNNSNGGTREFEEAVRNGDHETVKRLLDSELYILNDDYQGNNYDMLVEAMKSKMMFEMMIEHNFDLNAIHNGRGTLLDKLMRDEDRHWKEIDLIKGYGAKTLSELGVTVEMLGVHY